MNKAVLTDVSDLNLTAHALGRAQNRGIKRETLIFVIRHSDICLHAGEGNLSMRISNREFVKLASEGVKPSMIERTKNVVIIFNPATRLVVSVLLDHGSKSGRCYRSQWPTRSRKRQEQRRRNNRQKHQEAARFVLNDNLASRQSSYLGSE